MHDGVSHVKAFKPAIGESDFRMLREMGAGYIDKTGVISELLRDFSKVLLFPRPRRFGKTLLLSTIGYFFRKAKEDLTHLFEGLAVTGDVQAMKHFQKHPVISVSFKDVKADNLAATMTGIREQLIGACVEHRLVVDDARVDPAVAAHVRRVLDGSVTDDELPYTFQWLSQALHAYYGERVVLLIDEYDTPVQSGYMYDYFDKIVLFFRNFFSACLKDNGALFKGILTGILRVSKENMFSGLNHIRVHSIIDKTYATAFGFTEEEVASVIDPGQLEAVRAWYNGYLFGGQVIYNPWSILLYIVEGEFKPYWVNTGSSDLIEKLALLQGLGLSTHSETLLQGGAIEVGIDSNIVLRDIDKTPAAFWNFLLFAGYLKPLDLKLSDEGDYSAFLTIPNREIRVVYRALFRRWLQMTDPSLERTDELVRAMFAGDAAKMQKHLGHILLTAMSFHDGGHQPEKLYHGFILGLLVHLEKQYEVRSNRESGYGRADVLIRPKAAGKPGVVMEFKVLDEGETVEHTLQEAADQVRERKYAMELEAAGVSAVHEYAIVFDGKRAWVKHTGDVRA